MADVVRRVIAPDTAFLEADVRSDPEWLRQYRYEIPVLLCDGREIARHRVTEADLRTRLIAAGVISPRRPE
jgi:hypothetical protein